MGGEKWEEQTRLDDELASTILVVFVFLDLINKIKYIREREHQEHYREALKHIVGCVCIWVSDFIQQR